jgi:acyl-CoA reductase-like NAD-dependent aldehyde dehydrogenase
MLPWLGAPLIMQSSADAPQWSRSRTQHERQEILVEEAALAQAEEECLADADLRTRHRERDEERRVRLDQGYTIASTLAR